MFRSLRAVVRIMSNSGTLRQRMDKATRELVKYRPEDFPARLRKRAVRVLTVREKVRRDYLAANDSYFHFECLKPKQRWALFSDILALYEACLIDMGKRGADYCPSSEFLRQRAA
jgi:hypothetical protein